KLNAHIAPSMQLVHTAPDAPAPAAPEGMIALSHALRWSNRDFGSLHLLLPRDEEEAAARHYFAQLAQLLSKASALCQRSRKLLELAFTDDLTGVYNSRRFRIFLNDIVAQARTEKFPVTLFLFDIDDFKKYNDQFGHGVGDEILRQTAKLMRKC